MSSVPNFGSPTSANRSSLPLAAIDRHSHAVGSSDTANAQHHRGRAFWTAHRCEEEVMTTKITRDVLESRLHCKYKAHLKLAGTAGNRSDYETLQLTFREEVRKRAIEKILAKYGQSDVLWGGSLTIDTLRAGRSFVLNATLEDDLSLVFDGLKKVKGASKLGAFHYVPMLFHEGRKIGKEQRILLEVYGLILSLVQGAKPANGIVWHGPECKARKVRLAPDLRKAEQLLREIKEMANSGSLPSLILNDHCQVCEFRQRCHTQAVQEDNLSLLLGMQEKEIRAYNRKGFFTVTQLSHTFRYRKPRKRAKRHAYPHYFSLQARSIRTGIVHIHGTPSLPSTEAKAYLDIEGLPDQDFYYLIGIVVEVGESINYHPFWADKEEEEGEIFDRLADLIKSLPQNCPVFHYGNFETIAVKKILRRCPPDKQEALQTVLSRMVNVLSIVHRHVYFPTYSNSLKEIGRFLGHQWSSPDLSGIQSTVWREQWKRTQDSVIKEALLVYNKDDCTALKKLCAFIEHAAKARQESSVDSGNHPSIISTSELPKPPSQWPTYGRPTFALNDLKRANECAYFDYQRDRVYARTNKRFRQIVSRSKPHRPPLTPNKQIVIECDKCPACGAENIKRTYRLQRKTVDLKFFKGGVKKWIVLYRSWRYYCNSCGVRFCPKDWLTYRSRYREGIACWCVYQNIECRQTMWQVQDTLVDLFGLHFQYRKLYRFKRWIVRRYESMYEQIRLSILRGHLIHIDESKVNLRNDETGYVWVLASLDKVYYFYRPSREGTFLNEMLNGFKGVLVSDFFSAYESVKCTQQKCLLHFLIDVNNDLQKHPFDEEFKSFAQCFGTLLRRIVDTIDRHGLSTKFLSRYIPETHRMIERVTNSSYSSEVMVGYQKRIKKSGGRMFTFLNHDNIPWNNNNAEHAMKYLAKVKRNADGMFSERTLKETLILASVFQTCHFNGVSVLRFLLSGDSDLESILGE
jgi:predicted RecB family nuclease